MPRPKNVIPSVTFKIELPLDIVTKLELHLYSEAEQRIPFAARQRFIAALLRQYFDKLEGRTA